MKKQSKIRQALNPQKILFLTSILLSTLFLSSCNSGSKDSIQSSKSSTESTSLSETQNTSQDSLVHFLLDAAAKDFHEYQPPVPLGFRNVQIKYLTKPNEEKTYIMCGQFLNKDD